MGQGASTPKRKKKKKSKNKLEQDTSILKLEEKIAMVKQDLIRTRQMGEVNRRGQEDEIYKFEMELYKKKYLLHKRGNDAKSYLSFWDYVEIVNLVLHADQMSVGSGGMTLEQHRAALQAQAEEEKQKAAKGTVTKYTGGFNIYSFFEAFLLRRLHIAMILKHQRSKQTDVWNDIIMFMYNMMPGMKRRNKEVNEKYISLKPESNETMREMIKLNKKKIKLYERMLETLKEELEEEERMHGSMDNDNLLGGLEVPQATPEAADLEDFNTAKYYQKGHQQDDDEMSFKSRGSRRSKRSIKKKRESANSTTAEVAPRWKKSSRSKISQSINRDVDSSYRSVGLDSSNRSNNLDSSNRSNRSPSPSAKRAEDTSKITDDDIERFLYPNKPLRKSGGNRIKSQGSGLGSSRELPSDLEFDQDGRTTVSALHDDVSVGSGSNRNEPRTLAEAKARKKELENMINAMETPGEDEE